MTRVRDIDFLGDGQLQARLVRLSWAIMALGAIFGVALWSVGTFDVGAELARARWGLLPAPVQWVAALVVLSVLVLPVHELVHAALFRLFGGKGTRVRFGYQSGMLYAGCPGLVLGKGRFCAVLAGPALLLSAVLLSMPARLGFSLLGYAAFVLHLAGCSGDLLAIWLIVTESRCTHCEDTETGVRLLGQGQEL